MKNQALFSLKDKSKQLKCPLLQFLFGTLRVKVLRSMDMLPYFSTTFQWNIFRNFLFASPEGEALPKWTYS